MFNPKSLATTLALAVLVGIGPLSTDMYLPALPQMARELGVNAGQIQLTLSLFLAGFAVAQLIYGPLSDRFGRKPVMLGGLLLFIISSIACALADSIITLTLARFLQALGGSAGPVLGRAIVRDIHGPKESGRVLSHIASAMALAPAVAPIAGGYMTAYWGWASIFWFLALFAMSGFLLMMLKIAESAPQQFRQPKSMGRMLADYSILLKDRLFIGYTLSCTFVFSGIFSFLSGAPFVVIDYFGVNEKRFGLLFTLIVIGYMSGTLSGGHLSRRFGHRKLVGIGAMISLLSGGLLFYFGAGTPQHVMLIIAPMMVFMTGVGLVMPQAMAGALEHYPHMAGSASGLFGFIQMSIAGLVGIVVGHGYDGTPFIMSMMIALSGLSGLLAYWLFIRPE